MFTVSVQRGFFTLSLEGNVLIHLCKKFDPIPTVTAVNHYRPLYPLQGELIMNDKILNAATTGDLPELRGLLESGAT